MKQSINQVNCLIGNGDSYSASINGNKSWVNHLAQIFNLPSHNYALPGSSNDRICRSTIVQITSALEQKLTPLVIVGWSFIRRIEVWNYSNVDVAFERHENEHCKLLTLDFLLNKGLATPEQKAMLIPGLEIHKQLTDFYTQLYLLSNWLDKNHLPYLFFSAANNSDCPTYCFPYIDALPTTQWCNSNKKIYKMHDFSIPTWAEANDPRRSDTGHLSDQGHVDFAEFLSHLTGDLYEIL